MIMFLTLTTLWFYTSLIYASPLFPRDVFNPKITVPDASTVWDVGTTQTVKWDPTGLTQDTLTGMVVLGHIEDGDDNEHLMLNPPLAQGFLIKDGQINITVPDVPGRKDYIVVVFGDSGNASPRFTINNPNNPSGSSSSASSPTTSVSASVTTIADPPPSTTISEPIPITGTTITGGNPSFTSTPLSSVTPINSLPTGTAPSTPSTSATSGSSSGSSTTTASTADGTSANSNSTGSNAAGKLAAKQSYPLIALCIVVSMFVF
ncbi:hypothetical protein V5O48_000867 [Marasmius crinis-equi]|uniref:Uncharacterized protein n=1 Tax=Marasmius crinis-equi TaxID=585013 RepID=A0ABR3G050_9AGAR